MKRTFPGWFLLFSILLQAQDFPQIPKLVSAGRLAQAEQLIGQGLERNPGHPELLYWKSAVDWERGRAEEAIATLEQVLERGHGSLPHYELLGHIYQTRQEWKQAIRVFAAAFTRSQRPQVALKLGLTQFKDGQFAAAIVTLQPLAGSSNPQVFHLLGLSHFALKDLGEAASNIEASLRLDASNASLHYDLGLVYLQAERFEAAAAAFRRATQIKPEWAEAHLYLGRSLHDSNLAEDALIAFQRAGQLDPGLRLLHHHFGLLYKGWGRYDAALEEFEKELAAGSEYGATYFHLAEILYNRRQLERSVTLLARAIELEPENPEYRVQAGKQALAAGNYPEAARQLEEAIALDANSSPAYYLKGRLLQSLGNRSEAKLAFDRARLLADRRSGRVTP